MVYVDKRSLEHMLANSSVAPSGATSSSGDSQSDQAAQAFKRIERLVKIRDRSVKEVRARLLRDGVDEVALDEALDRACRCGYLDDMRFADVLIRSRLRAGKGLVGIVRELKEHNINPENIPDFPQGYLERVPSQADAAFALLCRKPPRAKNAQQAAYAKLIRAGYPSSVASEATRKWYDLRNKDKS